MVPTCENNVKIKLTPKNFLQIYQYLGIFVLPETNTCDINKAKYFNQIMKKLVIFVHFKVSIFPRFPDCDLNFVNVLELHMEER